MARVVTKEVEEFIKRNATLPASERMTVKQIATKFNISTHTISYTKSRLGCQNKKKPSSKISDVESFVREYDESGFGNKEKMLEKYGFRSLRSLHARVNQLRKK